MLSELFSAAISHYNVLPKQEERIWDKKICLCAADKYPYQMHQTELLLDGPQETFTSWSNSVILPGGRTVYV